MLATIASVPELALTEEEAKNLADASARVARHYDLKAAPKTLDWINLCIALAGIYGPKAVIIAGGKKEKKAAGADGIFPIAPMGSNGGAHEPPRVAL